MEKKQVVLHKLPDESEYGYDYWDWYLDNDGWYGKDGNGLIIMSTEGRVYKHYTQFSRKEILNALEEDDDLKALSNLMGKEYAQYKKSGYSQGERFIAYYPKDEFCEESLQELACVGLGGYTIYEVQSDSEEFYEIENTIITFWDGNFPDELDQIREKLGVDNDTEIIIKEPRLTYVYE